MAGAVQDAIEAIRVAFEALRIENGYQFDVRYTSRHLVAMDTLSSEQTPAVFVVRPPGETSKIEEMEGRVYRQVLALMIFGFLRTEGEENPDDAGLATSAEALVSDIKKLVMTEAVKNPPFGDADLYQVLMVEDFNDAGWDSNGALVGVGIEAWVYWNKARP